MVKSALSKLKDKLMGAQEYDYDDYNQEDYIEVDTDKGGPLPKQKILIKPYVIEDFADVKAVLDALRDGVTIALVNIRPLKERDIIELKRAVNKLKKTCDAIEGDIAGFGDDWIVVTPSFAKVFRGAETEELEGE